MSHCHEKSYINRYSSEKNRFNAEDMTCTVSSHADIFVGLYIVVTYSCAEAECLIFHKVKVEVSFM